MFYFICPNFIRGSSLDLFPKCMNWPIWPFELPLLPLCAFSGKLQNFPTVLSKTILDQTQQYTPVFF